MEIDIFEHTLSDSDFKEGSDKDQIFSEFGEADFLISAQIREVDESFDHPFGTKEQKGYEVYELSVTYRNKEVSHLLTSEGKSNLEDYILENKVDYSSFED